MFLKLLIVAILLIGLAHGHPHSLRRKSSHINCTKNIPVEGRRLYANLSLILASGKREAWCFTSATRSVRVVPTDTHAASGLSGASFCDTRDFDVFDGCNATNKGEKIKKAKCSIYGWHSKTKCLKIVSKRGKHHWKKQHHWRYDRLWYLAVDINDHKSLHRISFIRDGPARPTVQKKTFRKRGESGSIQSPNYPGSYPNNREYTYNIELRENQRVELIFRRIDLQKNGKTSSCEDNIEIYDGFTSWSSRLYKICGDGNGFINKAIIAKNNKLKVKFVSDGVNGNNKGFNASYSVYQTPIVTNMTQKVTGVVIGTACGLVFLALTFLAICHSRRLTLLYFFRRHNDIQSLYAPDVVQEDGPPSYGDVMASPEKYPLTGISKRKKDYYVEIPENEDLPPYPGLITRAGPGEDVQSSADEREMSRDVETVELLRNVQANVVSGSREPRDSESDVTRESDVASDGYITRSYLRKGSHPKDEEREKTHVINGSDVGERDVRESYVGGSDVGGSDISRSDVSDSEMEKGAVNRRDEGKNSLSGSELSMTNKYDVQLRGMKSEDGRETFIHQTSTNEITTDV
ncbi:uncharacterized protein LOC114522885 isoform X2 [Dendronephthya gigantea]|uniref:uncharacterized protein LOC114522885 isoform X2 n=1 Tax=Dendronephthya gigantea TaxID=151771 RepID=UPI00106D8D4F|nr:uncharacterized protein LOC114522885 isoform X2 [Dendronephthya gigantea]